MNILVVNDDGYFSHKLTILADAFKKHGNVFIVAPHLEQSGASSSITVHQGINVHEHGNHTWSVEGTPSDCVKFALFGLKLKIDLVVSGINNGLNIGLDTIYSGTVGACMEALMYGNKAVAFSSDYNSEINITDLENVINFIFDFSIISNQYILNINLPKANSKGIVVTNLSIKAMEQYYEEKNNHYFAKRKFHHIDYEENTDTWAFENGFTSITPLKLGNGDKVITKQLSDKVNKKC